MWAVICTKFGDEFDGYSGGRVVYGPFRTAVGAELFAELEAPNWDYVNPVALIQPPGNPQIHPNQAQIGDYIDPSVAN